MLNWFGRKKSLIFNNIYSIVGGLLAFVSIYVKSPECIFISRLLFGVQSGMAISVVPVYLSEISEHNIRGQTGTINEISITFGIVVSQILGLDHLLGKLNIIF